MKKQLMSILTATAMMVSAIPFTTNAVFNYGTSENMLLEKGYSETTKDESIDFISRVSDTWIISKDDFESSKIFLRTTDKMAAFALLRTLPNVIKFSTAEEMSCSEITELISSVISENIVVENDVKNNTFVIRSNYPSGTPFDEQAEYLIDLNKSKEIYDVLNEKGIINSFKFIDTGCTYQEIEMVFPAVSYDMEGEKLEKLHAYVEENNLPVTIYDPDEVIENKEFDKYPQKYCRIVPNENTEPKDFVLSLSKIEKNTEFEAYNLISPMSNVSNEETIDLFNAVTGDANNDGETNMADAVMIMQSLANPNKYGINGTHETHITSQGEFNGDMDGNGLTNADALEIQKMLLKLS